MTIRSLHLINRLGYGGVDTWLTNLARLRRGEVSFDFVVTESGRNDRLVESFGCRIHRVRPSAFSIWNADDLGDILAKNKYDVVHVPITERTAYSLKIASLHGVPVRIAHSHGPTGPTSSPLKRFARFLWRHTATKYYCDKYATSLLACSEEAGEFYFGKRLWKERHPEHMVYCGIPPELYDVDRDPAKRDALCREYDIPNDALVIGHIGRLAYQKNQEFLLDVFAELAERDRRYVLFLGGEGPYRNILEAKAESLGLEDQIRMPGNCSNVPELFCRLCDVFFLPSRFEGLPVVLMESAAAGLHAVCSDVITKDIVETLPGSFTLLSLSSPREQWCDALERGFSLRKDPRDAVKDFEKTPFTVENSMKQLLKAYTKTL